LQLKLGLYDEQEFYHISSQKGVNKL